MNKFEIRADTFLLRKPKCNLRERQEKLAIWQRPPIRYRERRECLIVENESSNPPAGIAVSIDRTV